MLRARSLWLVSVLALACTLPAGQARAQEGPCDGGGSSLRECAVESSTDASILLGASSVAIDLGARTDAPSGGSAAGVSRCRTEAVGDDWEHNQTMVHHQQQNPDAVYYLLICGDGDDAAVSLRYYFPGAGQDPVADGLLTEFVQEAFDRVSATPPVLAVSPGDGRPSLVGVATWLAIEPDDWEEPPLGAVTAGPITVTAWLEPEDVTYELGNGDVTVCEGPGNVYDPALAFVEQAAECSYVYATVPRDHTGDPDVETYPVSATVGYTPRYRVEGFPGLNGEYSLDRIEGPTATAEVTVHELRAVRVAN